MALARALAMLLKRKNISESGSEFTYRHETNRVVSGCNNTNILTSVTNIDFLEFLLSWKQLEHVISKSRREMIEGKMWCKRLSAYENTWRQTHNVLVRGVFWLSVSGCGDQWGVEPLCCFLRDKLYLRLLICTVSAVLHMKLILPLIKHSGLFYCLSAKSVIYQ